MKRNIILLFLLFITAFFTFNIKARAAEYQYCEYQMSDEDYNKKSDGFKICFKSSECKLNESFIGFKLSVVNVNGYALPLIDDTKSSSLAYISSNNLSKKSFYDSDKFKCADTVYIDTKGNFSSKAKLAISNKNDHGFDYNYPLSLITDKNNIPSKEFNGLNGHSNIDITSTTDCAGILGDFKTDLEEILKIIRIIGPLLVVIYSTYDYLSAVLKKDDDALKKANGKLVKRLILVAILFFLPIILDLILGFIDEKYTTCIK